MIRFIEARSFAALVLLGAALAGCTASDAGTTNVKYDASARKPGDRPDLPPDAKAKMDAAMKGGAAKP